jgi:hypothetical protein
MTTCHAVFENYWRMKVQLHMGTKLFSHVFCACHPCWYYAWYLAGSASSSVAEAKSSAPAAAAAKSTADDSRQQQAQRRESKGADDDNAQVYTLHNSSSLTNALSVSYFIDVLWLCWCHC